MTDKSYTINKLTITGTTEDEVKSFVDSGCGYSDCFDIMKNRTVDSNMVLEHLSHYGFPCKETREILSLNKETTRITGSFLLHTLTHSNHCFSGSSSKWEEYPVSDIDIFTTNKYLHVMLNEAFNQKATKNQTPQYEFVKRDNCGMNTTYNMEDGKILDIYEWKSVNGKIKLQVIVVSGDVNTVIDDFDYDFVKARYDGDQVEMSFDVFKSIISMEESLNNSPPTIREFDNTLKRRTKYMSRGFKIILPDKVHIQNKFYTFDPEKYPNIAKQYMPFGKSTNTFIVTVNGYPSQLSGIEWEESDDESLPPLISLSEEEPLVDDVDFTILKKKGEKDELISKYESAFKILAENLVGTPLESLFKSSFDEERGNYEEIIKGLDEKLTKLNNEFNEYKQKILAICNE